MLVVHLTVHSMCHGTKLYSASDDKRCQKVSKREIVIPSDKPLTDEAFHTELTGARNSCYPMIHLDMSKKMFYSPGYPAATYPNNSDCTVVLTGIF
ncbi:hypothetical protein WA026_013285 [Henosepilachna vigintioctopunctata]|uniref:CUB domain-containing protein n=1 Tax=Henosepilachna vigintioctopunctata TaxID=420089 RepID=A0AAW1V6N5_9CUCU